jgi:peptide deformylase
MALLKVLKYPDPRLHKVAEKVEDFDAALIKFVDDMKDTMYDQKGIGLAATQVDVHKRIIVIDVSEDKNEAITLINPTLMQFSGDQQYDEGCLSVPGFFETINRHENIKIQYQDIEGNLKELTANGLLSVCIQHEMDHLVGKVFVEYLSQLKQQRIKKKIQKLLKN